jgi:hypothetical protein
MKNLIILAQMGIFPMEFGELVEVTRAYFETVNQQC